MPNLLLCADEYSNSYRVLILAKGTAVPKSFIVPLFALQAPAPVFSWIQYVIDSCILLSCLVYLYSQLFQSRFSYVCSTNLVDHYSTRTLRISVILFIKSASLPFIDLIILHKLDIQR